MIQAIFTYCIVAVAAAWLVWTLFLPDSLKGRLRPAAGAGHAGPGAAGECRTCPGCPPAAGSAPARCRIPGPPEDSGGGWQ